MNEELAEEPLAGGVTELVPLDDERRAVLSRERISLRPTLAGIPVAALAGELLVWAAMARAHTWSSVRAASVLAPLAAVLVWLVVVAWSRISAHRDLSGGTFVRYRGPLRVERTTRTVRTRSGRRQEPAAHRLRLGGQGRLALPRAAGQQLEALALTAGEVDHAAHTKQIFEIRGADGAVVFVGAPLRRLRERQPPPA